MGEHYVGKSIAHKIMYARLWWPTIFQDTKNYFENCDICQRVGKPSRREEMPLNPLEILHPFDKWEIYFIRPINPPAQSSGAQYIITTTNYLTRST